MKFTVLGFSQEKLIEMSLDLNDALILRWFVDFYSTGRMHKITAPNGCVFVQVNYKALLDDVPIIGVSSGDVLKRRFNKLVSAGLMEHYTFRSGGTFSCYRLTDEYENLISAPSDSKADCPTQKSEGYDSKVGGGTTQKSEQKNPSIIHPSTKSDLRLGEESAEESRGKDKETPPPTPSTDKLFKFEKIVDYVISIPYYEHEKEIIVWSENVKSTAFTESGEVEKEDGFVGNATERKLNCLELEKTDKLLLSHLAKNLLHSTKEQRCLGRMCISISTSQSEQSRPVVVQTTSVLSEMAAEPHGGLNVLILLRESQSTMLVGSVLLVDSKAKSVRSLILTESILVRLGEDTSKEICRFFARTVIDVSHKNFHHGISTTPYSQSPAPSFEESVAMEFGLSHKRMGALALWLQHKKEKKQGYKPTGLRAFIKAWQDKSDDEFSAAVGFSISQNYSGLFSPKQNNSSYQPTSQRRSLL